MTTQPTTTPRRIQRRRTAGQPGMPPGATYVGRGSKWGNPNRVVRRADTGGWHIEHTEGGGIGTFPDRREAHRVATEIYRAHMVMRPELVAAARAELAGRDLACWCPRDQPCHADVLLELSNQPSEVSDARTA